jgi:hypothetical protein
VTTVGGRARGLVGPLAGHAALAAALLFATWFLLSASDATLRPEAETFHLDPSEIARLWGVCFVLSAVCDASFARATGNGVFFGGQRSTARAVAAEVSPAPVSPVSPAPPASAWGSTWGSAWGGPADAAARSAPPPAAVSGAAWGPASESARGGAADRRTARGRAVKRRSEELGRRAAWPLAGALFAFTLVSGRLVLDIVGDRTDVWIPLAVLFLLATPVMAFCLWALPEVEAATTASPGPGEAAEAAGAIVAAPVALLLCVGVGTVLWWILSLIVAFLGQVLAWTWPFAPVIAGPIAIVVALKAFAALLRRGEARVVRADPSFRSSAEEERDVRRSVRAWVVRMREARTSIEPATHQAAERAAADLYAAAGLAAPRCLWARSPREAAALLDATGARYGTRPPAELVQTGAAAPPRLHGGDAGAGADTIAVAWRALRFQRFEQLVDDNVLWGPSRAGVVGERLPVAPDRSLALYPDNRSEARRLAAAGYAADAGVRPLSATDTALIALMEATGGWWCTADAIVLCERPVERVGSSPVLPDGPAQAAYRYADDMWLFMPSGRVATDREVHLLDAASGMDTQTVARLEPPELRAAVVARMGRDRYAEAVASSATHIAAEQDQAIARAALAAFGEERFVTEAGLVVDSDLDAAGRMRRLWCARRASDPAVFMVEVVNSTPEPDGSRRHHFLRVPPGVLTCGRAVAWTFGMERGDYAPTVES